MLRFFFIKISVLDLYKSIPPISKKHTMSTFKYECAESSREQATCEVVASVAMKNLTAAAEDNGPVLSSVFFSTGRFLAFNDKPNNFRLVHTAKRDKKATIGFPFVVTSGNPVRDAGTSDAFVVGGINGEVAFVEVKASEADPEQFAAEIVSQGAVPSGKRIVRIVAVSFAQKIAAALTEDGATHIFSANLADAAAVQSSTNDLVPAFNSGAVVGVKGCFLNGCPVAGGLLATPAERDSVDIISVGDKKSILKDTFTPHGDAGTGLAAFVPSSLSGNESTVDVGLVTCSANLQELRLWHVHLSTPGAAVPKLVQTISLPGVGFSADAKPDHTVYCDTLVKIGAEGDVIAVGSPVDKHIVVLARQLSAAPGMTLVQRISDFKLVGMGGLENGMILSKRFTKEGSSIVAYMRASLNISRADLASTEVFGSPNVGNAASSSVSAALAGKVSPAGAKRSASPRTAPIASSTPPTVRVGAAAAPMSTNPNVIISSTSMISGNQAVHTDAAKDRAVTDALAEQAASFADTIRTLQASIQELQGSIQGGGIMRKEEALEKGRRHATLTQKHNNQSSPASVGASTSTSDNLIQLLLESVPEAMTLSMHRVAAQQCRDVFPKAISKTVEEAVRQQQQDLKIPAISASKLPSVDALDAAIAQAHSAQTKMINFECDALIKSLDTSRDSESTQQCLRASKAFMNGLQHAVRDLSSTVDDVKRNFSGSVGSSSGAAGAASTQHSSQHTVNQALELIQKGEFNSAFDSVLGLDDDVRLLEFIGNSTVEEKKEEITTFNVLSIPVFAGLVSSLAKNMSENLGSAPLKLEWISALLLSAAEVLSDKEEALKVLTPRDVEDLRMCKTKFRGVLEELEDVPEKEIGNMKVLRMAKRTAKRIIDF